MQLNGLGDFIYPGIFGYSQKTDVIKRVGCDRDGEWLVLDGDVSMWCGNEG